MNCQTCSLHRGAEAGAGAGVAGSGLSRRDFVERATVAAIAGLLVACGADGGPTGVGVTPPPPSGGPWEVTVGSYAGLDHVGGVAKVSLSGGAVAGVGRIGETEYVAYGLACTHQGTQVNANGDGWLCPNHGSEYDTGGHVVRGPATLALVRLQASYDADTGVLTIDGV